MDRKKWAVVAMSCISIFWAPTFGITKALMFKLGPLSIAFVRFLLAALLLFAIRCAVHSKEKIARADYKLFFFVTIGCPLHYILSNIASVQLDATESMVFSSFQCIITLVGESLLLGTLVTPKKSFCVGIASVGAVLTMNIGFLNKSLFMGYACMLGATVSWVLYCILMLKILERYKIVTLIYYQCAATAVILLPSVFLEQNNWGALNSTDYAYLLFEGCICIAICFLFNAYALKQIGPIPVSLFMNVGPVMVLLLGVFFDGLQINLLQIAGTALIILGIILTTWDITKRQGGVAPNPIVDRRQL